MKKVILRQITLSGWKGQDREVYFNDGINTVRGRNGSGKTSLFKAFCWLLTGYTDAVNVKNHELFDNRVEINHETPSACVKAVIDVDGRSYTVERSATPGFTRKRSTNEWVKSASDTYSMKIDDVETKASDFNAFINDTFGSIDMLPYMLMGERFANMMAGDKDKARKVLESMVGEISILDMKGDYSCIEEDIEQYGIDVLLDRYKNQMKPLRKTVEQNEAVIKIKQSDLSQLDSVDFDGISSKINEATERIAAIDREIGGSDEDMRRQMQSRACAMKEVADAEERLSTFVSSYSKSMKAELSDIELELKEASDNNIRIMEKNKMFRDEFNANASKLESEKSMYEELSKRRDSLVQKRNNLKSMVFDGDVCKYCGQKLPYDRVNELKKAFNEQRDSELELVISEGMEVRCMMDSAKERISGLSAVIEKGVQQEPLIPIDVIREKLQEVRNAQKPVEETDEYGRIIREIIDLKAAVPEVKQKDNECLAMEKRALMKLIKDLSREMGKKDVKAGIERDIESYKETTTSVYRDIARIEGKIDAVKQYIEERASLVSERINRKMSSSHIVMYTRQKDGELRPDCVLVGNDGVKYATMNTSSRIKACLELQRMFCDHFGINMPVFIDESSVFSSDNIPKFDLQTIMLYASDDKYLTVS